MASRTLNFYANKLSQDVTLLLVFDPPSPERLLIDQYSVCWKVITLRAQSHCKATVKYSTRMAFGFPQVTRDNLIEAESWQELETGQAVTLVETSTGKAFSPDVTPMTGSTSHLMTLKNRCNDRVNVGIGFVNGDGLTQRYESTLQWEGVGSNTNVSVQFTPVLRVYLTSDYKATDVLRGDIETPAIFTRDLNTMDIVTAWNVTESSGGDFQILPAAKV